MTPMASWLINRAWDPLLIATKNVQAIKRPRYAYGSTPKIYRSTNLIGYSSPFERINELEARAKELLNEYERVQGEIQSAVEEAADAEAPAEDIAKGLEEGGSLPPIPPEWILGEPEPAEEFRARIEAEIAEVEAAIDGVTPLKTPPGYKDPQLDDDVVREDEILGIYPAPNLPPEIEEQTKKVERIMYVVRRGHLEKTPSATCSSLQNKGLISDDVSYEDNWVQLSGISSYAAYMKRLDTLGVRFEVCKVFAECYDYDPIPQWRMVANLFMHFPLPLWYLKYIYLHSLSKDFIEGALSDSSKDTFRKLDDYEADVSTLYPRHPQTQSECQVNGTCHIVWINSSLSNTNLLSFDSNGTCSCGQFTRFPAPVKNDTSSSSRLPARYSQLLPIEGILDEIWLNDDRKVKLEPSAQPFTTPPTSDDPDDDITKEQAEALLRDWLGDDFDDIMAQMPKPGKGKMAKQKQAGTAFKEGNVFTVALSVMYRVDPLSGQIDRVTAEWGEMGGRLLDARDAYDMYVNGAGVFDLNFLTDDDE